MVAALARREEGPEHALVTGAAGSIGGALAARLAAQFPACRLTLVDRTSEAVAPLAGRWGDRVCAAGWDLARPEGLEAHWREAVARAGPVDLLINCAGLMEVRSFAATSWELGGELLAVNLTSPLRLMQLAVAGMLPRGRGWIANVSSMAGKVPLRGCAYYGAAKAALALASEIARLELAGRGLHVLTVYPGPVASALERRARAQLPATTASRLLPTGRAEAIAERVLAGLLRRRARVVFPDFYWLAHRFAGLSTWVTEHWSPTPLDG